MITVLVMISLTINAKKCLVFFILPSVPSIVLSLLTQSKSLKGLKKKKKKEVAGIRRELPYWPPLVNSHISESGSIFTCKKEEIKQCLEEVGL